VSVLEKITATLAPGYTVEPITMIRAEDTEPCIDARGPECPHQHVTVLRCEKKHRHTASCSHRVHLNVEVPGHLITSADGKFRAKVFADADAEEDLLMA
jgi:hypothetical protein